MCLAIVKFLEEEILAGTDMPTILSMLKIMKEHKDESFIESRIL